MKTRLHRPPARRRGYFLLECLAYMAVLAVVLVVTMRGFSHCWDNSMALRRNADDIIRVLHAGEQWRADLRAAREPVQLSQADSAEQLLIPSAGGPIIYTFVKGELRRQTSFPAADQSAAFQHPILADAIRAAPARDRVDLGTGTQTDAKRRRGPPAFHL